MSATRREGLWAAGALAVMAISTLGEGGATPAVMLAWHAALVAMLVLRIAAGAAVGEGTIPRGVAVAFGLFAAWVVAGAVRAPYAYAALLFAMELAAAAVLAVLAARAGGSLRRWAPAILLPAAAVHGIVALAQLVDLVPIPSAGAEGGRPNSSFLNANHLGAWLGAALLASLPAPADSGASRRFALWIACAVPALAGVTATGSRGAFIGFVAGGAIWTATAWRSMTPLQRRGTLAVAAITLTLFGGRIALRFGPIEPPFPARGTALETRVADPYPFLRLRIWQASLAEAWASPWFGAGPGQFKISALRLNFPLDGGPLRYARFFATPHSDLLRGPCELGWPAAACLLGAAAAAAVSLRRRAREGEPVPMPIVSALAALAAQSAVDDLTGRPAVYLLGAALVGALVSVSGRARPASVSGVGRGGAVAMVLAAFFVLDVAPYRAFVLAADLPRGRLDGAGRARLERALRWNPCHPDLWLRRAEDLAWAGPDLDVAAYAEAREAAERARRLSPRDPVYARGVARVERLGFRRIAPDVASRERADATYREAAALAPTDPFYPLEEADFLLEAGDPHGAAAAAARALVIEPNAVPGHLLLAAAIAYASGGDPSERARAEGEIRAAEAIAERYRSWPRLSPYEARLLAFDAPRAAEIRRSLAGAVPGAP